MKIKKMWKGLLIFAVALLFLTGTHPIKAEAGQENFVDNENGVITVKYNNKDGNKMKILVTKDGEDKNYAYNLEKGQNELDIPLTMGNGSYKIRISKNTTGNKYSVLETLVLDLKLTNEDEVYLQSNVIVDYELTDKAIKKAASLTKDCKTEAEKTEVIYKYIVENFLYDYEKIASLAAGYIPDIEIIYKNKKGICYDISSIIAAMLRSQGITVKLVTGYTPNITSKGKQIYHAWNVIYDSKSKDWYTIDATYDVTMYKGKKKYTMKKKAADYTNITYQY